ncbi:MAG: O-methyltransferase [Pseudomonadota bacterium]
MIATSPSFEALSTYAEAHSKQGDQALVALSAECQSLSSKSCGPIVGRLLTLLVSTSQSKMCLELGTWLGYSALCIAEGLPSDGRLVTCDSDIRTHACLERFAQHPKGRQIELRVQSALSLLDTWTEPLDFVFLDADKANYPLYYERLIPLIKVGGLLVIDNMLWSGAVLNPQHATDRAIDTLNKTIVQDARVDNLLLTIRDGLQVVRKCSA